jgi:hypothetical protein
MFDLGYFPSQKHEHQIWGLSTLFLGYWGLFPQGDSVEVKNEWSYTTTPHVMVCVGTRLPVPPFSDSTVIYII